MPQSPSPQSKTRLSRLDAQLAPLTSPVRTHHHEHDVPAAWFLGPRAENEELLAELIRLSIGKHAEFRRSFHADDPAYVTPEIKDSDAYRKTVGRLKEHCLHLFELLQSSAPFSSMRYQGHMLWDQVLPSTVGYFAAMLYNQNNVAAEASPVTTQLEIEVGNDLCRMLGFAVPDRDDAPEPGVLYPWGHITCDGSVANIEAMWVARNARFRALALAHALQSHPALLSARKLRVRVGETDLPLVEMGVWGLLNLPLDTTVALADILDKRHGIAPAVMTEALREYAVENIGWVEFYRRFMGGVTHQPVILAPVTRHYSWPKSATLLGLGQNAVIGIRVDMRGRMDIDHLKEVLERCLVEHVPVLAVVAVIGSTEESAVDPLEEILQQRDLMRRRGLDFIVHCDAAWGGYFSTMLRPPEGGLRAHEEVPIFPMSPWVARQYELLHRADSITVDPHKGGYIPYPAGAICYRNAGMRDLVSLKAPVIFHGQSEPTVGIYGVEGSKPGAAAAAVYLAHKVIRPDRSGYGRILGQCMWTSKRLYCRLLTLKDPRFEIIPFQQLPAEIAGSTTAEVAEQRRYIGEHFVRCDNRSLRTLLHGDEEAYSLFMELGSDQVILAFSLNFRDADGQPNRCLSRLNLLNEKVFQRCSIVEPRKDMDEVELILTASSFDPAIYGQDFVDHYCRRLGVDPVPGMPVQFLISTTMDPWTTDAAQTDFLETVEDALRNAAHAAIDEALTQPNPNGETDMPNEDSSKLSDMELAMLKEELQPYVTKTEKHAFIMVGDKTLFLCHMTMFHMEDHCYQLILEASLPDEVMQQLHAWRKENPTQTYFLNNIEADLMTLPEIQSGKRRSFRGEIFNGIPAKDEYASWPWAERSPIVKEVEVTIERVVHARHFNFAIPHPESLTYILFGAGDEAHMQSYQSREPDRDHVLSLSSVPAWLPAKKLEAGVEVNFPGKPAIPTSRDNPLPAGCYDVEYQGFRNYLGTPFANTYPLSVGTTWWCSLSPLNMRPPKGGSNGGNDHCHHHEGHNHG